MGKMFVLTVLGAALTGGMRQASAQQTGGTTTKTLEYRVQDIKTAAETKTVETYETRMLGFLAGNPNAVVDVFFALPFGDAAVQAATLTTRSLLSSASADPLSFSGPTLTSSSRVLSDSSSATSDALTGEEALWVDTVELVGEELFQLNSDQFGCIAEVNGIQFDCSLDFGELFVAAGDTVLLTSAGVVENILRTTVTTNTFLNASVYEIVGTSDINVVPEPSTALLVGFAGLIGWRSMARRRHLRAWDHSA
jgi:hypothetical protein